MTILKLGFAMGGGVSLGTFNAGALAQSIKLAILYGLDKDGNLFDKVEIDVFSGASAGSISLALMIRALAYQNETQRTKAKASLLEEFGNDFQNLPPEKKDAIIAAEVMLEVQRDIWTKQLRMDKLLDPVSNDISNPDSLKYSAGILNRAALEDIAVNLIKNSPIDNLNITKKILADRVLFASSLSNLTPTVQDARGEFSVGKGGKFALGDGMTSNTHRESRVFDLHFKHSDIDETSDTDIHPKRWMRYHLGAEQDSVIGDIRKNDIWWRMVATAMASGAFPLAFEPVVLTRYQYEYGSTWPKELKDANVKEFDFTYIDGGVFNNEPIRDAFKLASFIDANDERQMTERAIIFVDPAVCKDSTNFRVPVQQRFKLSSPLLGNNWFGDIDGVDLEAKTSLSRLSGHAVNVIQSILNQARTLEGDKIYQVRNRFKDRNAIRKAYENEINIDVSLDLLFVLSMQITSTQKEDSERELLPPTALTIHAEVKRIISEEQQLFSHINLNIIQSDLTKIANKQEPTLSRNDWYLLLRFVLLDQSMRLSGKSKDIHFFAIAPFRYPAADTYEAAAPIELPGDKIFAFGGFMFEPASTMDMNTGIYCARQTLTTEKFLSIGPHIDEPPKLSKADIAKYKKAINRGTEDLADRVLNMFTDSFIPGAFKGLIKFSLKKLLAGGGLETDIELRIKLPDDLVLELDGRGRIPVIGDKDIQRVKLQNGYYLITFASLTNDGKWKGEHINASQTITLDKKNRKYADISMPDKDIVKDMKLYGHAYLEYDFSDNQLNNDWKVTTSIVPVHQVLKQKSDKA
jgi:predicted acylesterase/phospholipase RssA